MSTIRAKRYLVEQLPSGRWRVATIANRSTQMILHDPVVITAEDVRAELAKRSQEQDADGWSPPVINVVIKG